MLLKEKQFKYSQAREAILDAILSGNLAPDTVLPSEQELCAKLGIGRNTLRAALRELGEAGIITKAHGRPSRVNPEALRKQRAPLRRVAWVDTKFINHPNPIYFDIFRSVSEQAALRNVALDYISLSIEAVAENFFQKQQEYDGLILGEFTRRYENNLAGITHENVVCVDCPRPGIAHCVETDSYLGGGMAARTLLEAGYRRPAFLGFIPPVRIYQPFDERLQGFRDELERAGIELPSERVLLIATDEEEEHFDDFLKQHLAALRQADSLFVVTDAFAVAALYALSKFGLRVPEDLALIGFDGLTLCRFVSPVLTTIRQPVEEIGIQALKLVLNPSESASWPARVLVPPTLQPGETI